jgi:hypothetical protein
MNILSLRFLSAASTAFVLSSLSLFATPARAEAKNPMTAHGSILVDAVGPYVERGTYRIQVLAKLGEPSARLKDGTWLYERFAVRDGTMKGTLVIRFRDGQVQHLALATPASVAALRAADNHRQLAGNR